MRTAQGFPNQKSKTTLSFGFSCLFCLFVFILNDLPDDNTIHPESKCWYQSRSGEGRSFSLVQARYFEVPAEDSCQHWGESDNKKNKKGKWFDTRTKLFSILKSQTEKKKRLENKH